MVLLVALRELMPMAGAAAPAGGGSSNRQWHLQVIYARARTGASTLSQPVVALERA